MTLKGDDERRGAQRFALPKPAHATLGGFEAHLVEISLVGCQITHTDRITPRARLPLRFKWRGKPMRMDATVMRSEMRSIGGKPAYMSGLAFCDSAADSPAVVREIVGWLANSARSDVHEEPAVESRPDEEVEVVSASYLQCTLSGATWEKLYVEKPVQPPEGFTIIAPSNDAEADVLCRAYQAANAQKRREMRARFELAIAQSLRKSG